MSLRSEDMLVNGLVYSTGTSRAEAGAYPKKGPLTSQNPVGFAGCMALVSTPCAIVDAGRFDRPAGIGQARGPACHPRGRQQEQ
jgi:hypothetical protein